MSGLKKNPFEVLGLTPEIAGRLGDKELFSLIKSIYRTLQKIYHPDKGTKKSPKETAANTARAVELNLAFEELDLNKDAESFHRHQRHYASRQNNGLLTRIAQLEKEIVQNKKQQSALADGYMEYLMCGLPWLNNFSGEPVHPVLAPPGVKLGLNDVAINQNVRTASWSLGSNYKEIVFDALGSMYYRPVGRSKPFAVNYIHLLGTVDTKQLDLLPLLDRVPPRPGFFKSPALDSRYGIDGAPLQVMNTLALDKFKQYCLPLLAPELSERNYLFSIHRPVYEQTGSIYVEGVIVKISKA